MAALRPDFLTDLAASLAYDLLKAGAARLRDAAFGNAEYRALQNAWEQAFQTMLAEVAADLDQDQINLLGDIWRELVCDEDVASTLLGLALADRAPDLTVLRGRFDALSYDSATLSVDFDAALIALTRGLADALLEAALKPDSPLYNRVSMVRMAAIHSLLREQRQTLETIAATVARLEEQAPEARYNLVFLGPASGFAIGDGATVTQQFSGESLRPALPETKLASREQRRADLNESIRETLELIKQYEDQHRLADDPRVKHRAEQEIANLRRLLENYQAELEKAAESLIASWPPNIPDERYYPLPGRERDLDQLLKVLQDPQGPPVVVIDGLGGLGKTAMAVELARRALQQNLFEGVVGDSAKQELLTGGEIVQVREATLDFDSLLDAIARQLGRWEISTLKPEEKRMALHHLLRQHRYLVLVDNLETAENANALVAHLRGFLGGSRAIITSRKQVRHDFACALSLQGLDIEDSLFFLRTDAEQRRVQQILEAPEERLSEIHEITGGAPLALKLVVAQARFLDLDLILKRLRQASGDLYPFIFRQSWEQLSPAAQRVLIYIGRTVVTTVSWEELASVYAAESEEELGEAIDQLIAYSLLEASFVAGQARYGIHPLTRHFVNSGLPEMWRKQRLL